MGVEPKIGVGVKAPQIIPFVHRVFHDFHHPFWGFSPYFWKHPYVTSQIFIPAKVYQNIFFLVKVWLLVSEQNKSGQTTGRGNSSWPRPITLNVLSRLRIPMANGDMACWLRRGIKLEAFKQQLTSGKLTWQWKMVHLKIYGEARIGFSMAMLVYQRVYRTFTVFLFDKSMVNIDVTCKYVSCVGGNQKR